MIGSDIGIIGTGWVRPNMGTPTRCSLRSTVLHMTVAWSRTRDTHRTVAELYFRVGAQVHVGELPAASKKVVLTEDTR